ncbi:hypothetical protein TNCV_671211 [Trichonephila clavipes]|nr:hypothetical protein TNCV_671211 [Trichonephila clavipes]
MAIPLPICTKEERRTVIRLLFAEGVKHMEMQRSIDNAIAMLNGLLHSNDFEERRVTRCIEVLPTPPDLTLDASAKSPRAAEQ